MAEIFYHKASDISLVDWFATFAPEPSEADISRNRRIDNAKANHNDKFIMRTDLQIKCDLRYEYAKEMMKVRGGYG